MMNSFNQIDRERLFNIVAGKAASADIEEFSLSVNIRGENGKKSSISDCIKRTESFEERTAKQKMQTFETELGRKKLRDSMEKLLQPALCVTCLGVFCAFLTRKQLI